MGQYGRNLPIQRIGSQIHDHFLALRLLLFIAIIMLFSLGRTSTVASTAVALHIAPVTARSVFVPPATPTPLATTQTAVASAPSVAVTHTVVSTIPDCQPDTTDTSASPIDLTNEPDGLTSSIDAPVYYQVYGTSATQLRAQVNRCAPASSDARVGSEFAAETDYHLTSRFTIVTNTDGSCSIADARIGLHTVIVLPSWQPTAAAPISLQIAWSSFIRGVTVHESGHVAIDQQYANQFLNDLQNVPETDCGQINATVQALAQNDTAALNAANDAYDARTNHGATQGAILP